MRHTAPAAAHRALAEEIAGSDGPAGVAAEHTLVLIPHHLDAIAHRLARLEPRPVARQPRGPVPGEG